MKFNLRSKTTMVALALAISGPLITSSAYAELLAQPPMTLAAVSSKISVGQTTMTTLSGGAGMGAVVYSTSTTTVCSITSGGIVTGLKVGACLISAVKAGDATYMESKATTVVNVESVAPKIQLKKYKTYYTISVNAPSSLIYSSATIQIGTKTAKKTISYKTAEVLILDEKGNALYYSDGPALKGTYYRVLLGNQIVKSQKIR